ncbi:MAG: hypothetical protein M3Y57_21130 [Acidobacteriota bacterium]|nr:hypothetical protein [Acidobacteriota bacterium]
MLRLSTPQRLPSPNSVIGNINQVDARLDQQPIHQIFDVEELQVKPEGPARRTRLEIWSDAGSRRFAAKWSSGNGSLKSGQWRTETGSSFSYTSQTHKIAAAADGSGVLPAFSRIEPDANVLEASFARWLRDRPWKPIASLADLSLWERKGASMQVQRVSNGLLRLIVRQEIAGVEVDFMALLEKSDYSLRVQRIRLSDGRRVVQFQLSSELNERPVRLSPAIFYPDSSVHATTFVREEISPTETPILPAADIPKPRIVSHRDASRLARRVEAYYVLHQAGACEGIPVTISEEDGGIRVSGQSPQVGSLDGFFTSVANVSDVMEALSELRDSNMQLSKEVRSQAQSGLPPDRMRQLRINADALESLASAFDQSQTRLLPDVSLHHLESMVHAHAANLSQTLSAMINPAEAGAGHGQRESFGAEAGIADWRSAATSVVEGMRTLTSSGSTDGAALRPRIEGLMRTVDDLTYRAQFELDQDRQSASIRDSNKQKVK